MSKFNLFKSDVVDKYNMDENTAMLFLSMCRAFYLSEDEKFKYCVYTNINNLLSDHTKELIDKIHPDESVVEDLPILENHQPSPEPSSLSMT